jgi:hypothetical protein
MLTIYKILAVGVLSVLALADFRGWTPYSKREPTARNLNSSSSSGGYRSSGSIGRHK